MFVRASCVLLCAAFVGLVGCGDEEDDPVRAARVFAVAVASADVDVLLTRLDPAAVSRLERAAERASNQVGGRRNIAPAEMLQIVDLDPTFQVGHTELVSSQGDHAQVRLEGADGAVHVLDLQRVEGTWRVRIPLPDATEPGSP